MNIRSLLANAIARRVAYVLVALALSWVGLGKAHAAAPDMPTAYSQCQEWIATNEASDMADGFDNQGWRCVVKSQTVITAQSCQYVNLGGPCNSNGYVNAADFLATTGCSGINQFDTRTGQCSSCATHQLPSAGWSGISGSSPTICDSGCQFTPGTMVSTDNGSTWFGTSAGAKPTGASCGVSSNSKPKTLPDRECKTVGTQTMCARDDGKFCASASNGKTFCWSPGETGTKTSDNVVQKRDPGTTATPPAPLPNGDTLNQSNPPTTTKVYDGSNGSGVTNTTTVTSYTTGSGADAGSTDQGDGAPGSDQGNGNSASGGGDCSNPPVVSGDAALAMVATQAWSTRCAVEAGNAVVVSGDIGDCTQPFTVTGGSGTPNGAGQPSKAQVEQLKAMRASICHDDKDGDGKSDLLKTDGTEGGDGDNAHDGTPGVTGLGIGAGMLDTSGIIGTRSCPQLGTLDLGIFGTFSLDEQPWFCTLVSLIHGALLLMGAFISLRILMGNG